MYFGPNFEIFFLFFCSVVLFNVVFSYSFFLIFFLYYLYSNQVLRMLQSGNLPEMRKKKKILCILYYYYYRRKICLNFFCFRLKKAFNNRLLWEQRLLVILFYLLLSDKAVLSFIRRIKMFIKGGPFPRRPPSV